MAKPLTSLKRQDGIYVFTSQGGSSTFTFRLPDGLGSYINYNPTDYKNQFSPVRGVIRETIGGGLVVQEFGQYDNDRIISFSSFLTKGEYNDLYTAKALKAQWTFVDYLGDSYLVRFDVEDGMEWDYKVKANDKTLCRFLFRVMSSV